METRKLNLEELEQIHGGGWGSIGCGVLMAGWGGVLAYGSALAGVTAGVSAGIALVWSGLSIGICAAVGSSEGYE